MLKYRGQLGFLQVGVFTCPSIQSFYEKVHLSLADISIDNFNSPIMIYVCLKQLKTNQLRKGVSIVIGKTDQPPLCPVSAILSYLEKVAGSLFVCENGHFLTRAHYFLEVKKVLELAGVDSSEFSGHSCRTRAASVAAANCDKNNKQMGERCIYEDSQRGVRKVHKGTG